jgi:hypothetical protein
MNSFISFYKCAWTYTRFLLLTTVVSVLTGVSTTAPSPSALDSVTGSRLTATTRREGMTRVRSSTTTSRLVGERLLRVLAFFVFFSYSAYTPLLIRHTHLRI